MPDVAPSLMVHAGSIWAAFGPGTVGERLWRSGEPVTAEKNRGGSQSSRIGFCWEYRDFTAGDLSAQADDPFIPYGPDFGTYVSVCECFARFPRADRTLTDSEFIGQFSLLDAHCSA